MSHAIADAPERANRVPARPPIRREPADANFTEATSSFATIERNMPGNVVFADRKELERFVIKSAENIAALSVILKTAVSLEVSTTEWPAGDFLPAFSAFVSDQVYEHQEAVGALLKAGGAA